MHVFFCKPNRCTRINNNVLEEYVLLMEFGKKILNLEKYLI